MNKVVVVVSAAVAVICAFMIPSTAKAAATVINFDEYLDATWISNQYAGVTFLGENWTIKDVALGIPVRSSPNALRGSGSGPIAIEFENGMKMVRVYVGDDVGAGYPIVLRAYDSKTGGNLLVQESVAFWSVTGVTNPLTVYRPYNGDILRVEIEQSSDGRELIDNLTYDGVLAMATNTLIHFDNFAANSVVDYQYDGVAFPDRPTIVNTAELNVAVNSSSNGLRVDISGESHTGRMVMVFDPPQGAVRAHVGYPPVEWDGNDMMVYMYAYTNAAGGTEVASQDIILSSVSPINYSIEVNRWVQQDIRRVEVFYWNGASPGGFEVIDDLEFGPVELSAVPDTTCPVVTLTQPTSQIYYQTNWMDTNRTLRLTGTINEENALNNVTLTVLVDGSVRYQDASFYSYVQGPPPNYTFDTWVNIGAETSVVRITATDIDGNVSTNSEREVAVYLMKQSTYLTNWNVSGGNCMIPLRSEPELVIPATLVKLTGVNFHSDMMIVMAPATSSPPFSVGEYVYVTAESVEPDYSSMTVYVPTLPTLDANYKFWIFDPRHRNPEWSTSGSQVFWYGEPSWVRMYGFGYHNTEDDGGWGDFGQVFPIFGYIPVLGCRIPRPSYLIYFAVYCGILELVDGTCAGMAASAQLLYNNNVSPGMYGDGHNMYYAAGFTESGYPARFTFNECGPYPIRNWWAYNTVNMGVQLSSDVIYESLHHMSMEGFFGFGGNMNTLINTIKDAPHLYLLSMMPAVGKGHMVTPYAVNEIGGGSWQIRVYDSNKHYNNSVPSSNPSNQAAMNATIYVNTSANTYSYTMAGGSVWSGNGLYPIPISHWESRNHLSAPGVVDIVPMLMCICGSADGYYYDDSGTNYWGWDGMGELQQHWSEVRAVTPMGGEFQTNRSVFFAPPSNTLNMTAGIVTRGGPYLGYICNRDRQFLVDAANADSGCMDTLDIDYTGERPSDFRFMPASNPTGLVFSFSQVIYSNREFLARWSGLSPTNGSTLRFNVSDDNSTVRLYNESDSPQTYRFLLQSVDETGAANRLYGPFILDPWHDQSLMLYDWPSHPVLWSVVESNGNSVSSGPAVGEDASPTGSDPDYNRNGIRDSLDLEFGFSRDRNGNTMADDVEPIMLINRGDADGNWIHCYGGSNRHCYVERSTDMFNWQNVEEWDMPGYSYQQFYEFTTGITNAAYRMRYNEE